MKQSNPVLNLSVKKRKQEFLTHMNLIVFRHYLLS